MALMDNLNLLYVALTRAVNTLYIFAPKPTKEGESNKISDLIYNMFLISNTLPGIWNKENLEFSSGKLQEVHKEEISTANLTGQIPNILNNQRNLKIRLTYNDLYEGEEGVLQNKINKGKIYHKIMERIINFNDIEPAVNSAIRQGFLSKTEAQNLIEILKSSLSMHQVNDWFNNTYKVLNELNIVIKEGETKRPDRVMISDEQVIVVDYKFTSTQNEMHLNQVKEYMTHLNLIENKTVTGYVWYVFNKELIKVI